MGSPCLGFMPFFTAISGTTVMPASSASVRRPKMFSSPIRLTLTMRPTLRCQWRGRVSGRETPGEETSSS
ncbi:hypothetical protein D3C79_1033540 [compost metagenome]